METDSQLPAHLDGLKFFRPVQCFFDELRRMKAHPNRCHHLDDHLVMLLLAYFNPAISGLRQLISLPNHRHVEGNLGLHRTSMGSFSEASSVFNPEPIRNIFLELADQAKVLNGQMVCRLNSNCSPPTPRSGNCFRAWSIHPVEIELTDGKTDERHVLPLQIDSDSEHPPDHHPFQTSRNRLATYPPSKSN